MLLQFKANKPNEDCNSKCVKALKRVPLQHYAGELISAGIKAAFSLYRLIRQTDVKREPLSIHCSTVWLECNLIKENKKKKNQ